MHEEYPQPKAAGVVTILIIVVSQIVPSTCYIVIPTGFELNFIIGLDQVISFLKGQF